MVDHSINGDFDLHFSEHDDLETVDGQDEFEQDVVVEIVFGGQNFTGEFIRDTNISEKITLLVTRIAKRHQVVENIEFINITELQRADKTIQVDIGYDTGDNFQTKL